MLKLDPSGWLILAVPCLVAITYVTYRGLAKNEFRRMARNGWATYRRGSSPWWEATGVNFLFLGCFLFMLWMALFDGSNFSREPALPMPPTTGKLVDSAYVDQAPTVLLECLAKGDARRVYPDGPGRWVVAVRNGKNAVMYTYEVTAQATGARVDVRRNQLSPFVSWKACLQAS